MSYLIQSTIQTVLLGPFVDDTDGKTAETGLAGSMTVRLSKNGAASAARDSSTAISHDNSGYYRVELNSTDLNTQGNLTVFASPSGALPVKREFLVVPQLTWDFLFLGGLVYADVLYWNGDDAPVTGAAAFLAAAATLGNILNFFSATGYSAANSTVGTVTNLTNGGAANVTQIGGDATAVANLKNFFNGTGYNANTSRVGQVGAVNNTVNANVVNLGGSSTDFDKLVALTKGAVVSLVAAGTNTTTVVTTALSSATTGFYKDKTFIAISGSNAGQGGKLVAGYDGATKRLTVEALTAPMAPGDMFVLVG